MNNIVEQNQRAIKRIVRPMLGFKSFRCVHSADRDRDHAFDQEGSVRLPQGARHVRSQPVVLAGAIERAQAERFTEIHFLIATQPNNLPE